MFIKLPNIDNLLKQIREDAPANAAGAGNIAGIGVGPKGEPGANSSVLITRSSERLSKEELNTPKSKIYDHKQLKSFVNKHSDELDRHLHDNNFVRKLGEREKLLDKNAKTYIHKSGSPKIRAVFYRSGEISHINHWDEPYLNEPSHRYMSEEFGISPDNNKTYRMHYAMTPDGTKSEYSSRKSHDHLKTIASHHTGKEWEELEKAGWSIKTEK